MQHRWVGLAAALLLAALPALTAPAAAQDRTPAPAGAAVRIISPADGAVVTSPVTVVFGLSGMGVAPAGVEHADTGHHHLLIDVDALPPLDEAIPKDEQHRHFGNGQTEAIIELAPGQHRLQLLMGDHNHIPHNPPVVSPPVTITVQ